MPNHYFAPGPDVEIEPKGPQHAFDEAVALLAPFKRKLDDHAPADAREALASHDPHVLAQAEVYSLAEYLNNALYRARRAPRVKDIVANLGRARDLLREANSAITSLDGWSRFHLYGFSQLSRHGVEGRWLPSYESDDAGEFVELAADIADQMDGVIGRLQNSYGDGQIADRGGAQSYEDRFLGSVKTRFIREAFEVFDAYHPERASSTDGSPFFSFVHKVFEFATGECDEDRLALAYKLRELISALHSYKKAKAEYWKIDQALNTKNPGDPVVDQLSQRQWELTREIRQLEAKFVPSRDRAQSSTSAKNR